MASAMFLGSPAHTPGVGGILSYPIRPTARGALSPPSSSFSVCLNVHVNVYVRAQVHVHLACFMLLSVNAGWDRSQ